MILVFCATLFWLLNKQAGWTIIMVLWVFPWRLRKTVASNELFPKADGGGNSSKETSSRNGVTLPKFNIAPEE